MQEESGADIYIQGDVLHVHAPGQIVGKDIFYDFAQNVQSCDLNYRRSEDRKVKVVVKAVLPDGKVKERHYGPTGGDKVEIKCATSDDESMKLRGEAEIKKFSFDGYDGTITTWMVPYIAPGDAAVLHDADYDYKDGRYFVRAVKTEPTASSPKCCLSRNPPSERSRRTARTGWRCVSAKRPPTSTKTISAAARKTALPRTITMALSPIIPITGQKTRRATA